MAALGALGSPKKMKMEPFWGSFLVVFLILLLLHSKRENAIRISPEVVFGIPKPHFFGSIFDHFLGPFPDPPLEGLFEPSWHARVPTYTHKVNFGPLLGSPWAPKSTLGASRIGQEAPKREVGRTTPRVFLRPGAALDASCAPKGSWMSFLSILDLFGWIRDRFWKDFGPISTPLCHQNRYFS